MAANTSEDEHDEQPFRTPLPMDDRLWRHPSELVDAAPAPEAAPPRASRWRFRRHPHGQRPV